MSMTPEIPLAIESLEAFGAILRKHREEKGLSLEALAKLTGVSKPYLANIETARTPGPPSEGKLRVLELALGFADGQLRAAADWLRTPASVRALLGQRTPRRADGAIDLDAVVAREKVKSGMRVAPPAGDAVSGSIRLAPVINKVAAGAAAEHGDLDYPTGVADAYVPVPMEMGESSAPAEEKAAWKSAFAARVAGDSMTPAFLPGDVVIVAPMEARDGEDCLVRLGPEENFATTLKRVYFISDHSGQALAIRLVPRNAAHAERVVPLTEVTGIYPVVYRMSMVRGREGAGS
jgi:repressor LexA